MRNRLIRIGRVKAKPALAILFAASFFFAIHFTNHTFVDVAHAQGRESTSANQPPVAMKIMAPFTLAGIGDFNDHHPFADAEDPGFDSLVKPLKDADVSIADMEGAMVDSANPVSGMPNTAIADLKALNIRMMTQANNHGMDLGAEGVFSTSALLDKAGIVHVGTGKDLQEARAARFLVTPKGIVGMVGMFSIDVGTNPAPARNSAATYATAGVPGAPGVNALHLTTYNLVTADQLQALRQIRDSIYARRDEVHNPVDPLPENDPANQIELFGTLYKVGPKPGGLSYTMDPKDMQEILRTIRDGKDYADFMIATIHCHQNSLSFQHYSFDNNVPDFLVDLAHKTIDAGADAFVASGVHTLRPVEIYKGKPIFYGVSNFIFSENLTSASGPGFPGPGGASTTDSAGNRANSERREWRILPWPQNPDNMEALLVTCRYDKGRLVEVRLYPADLGQDMSRPPSRMGMPMTPSPETAQKILAKVQAISKPFGTAIAVENNVGVIHVGTAASGQ
jgi:hypothetical protein